MMDKDNIKTASFKVFNSTVNHWGNGLFLSVMVLELRSFFIVEAVNKFRNYIIAVIFVKELTENIST